MSVHLSALPSPGPVDPVAGVLSAQAGGVDAVGLDVATGDETDPRWDRGAGSPLLTDLLDVLLVSRVTVLDVGTIALGGPAVASPADPRHRVLDLASRLGAQFVTARPPAVGDASSAVQDLCAQAAPFRVRPVLLPTPGTSAGTIVEALAAVAGTGASVLLDVRPSTADPEELAELIVEAGDALGYVRLPIDELRPDMGPATSMLATLPPWVPVVIGAPPAGAAVAFGATADPIVVALRGALLAACRRGVDRLLIHPRALGAEQGTRAAVSDGRQTR